MARRVPSEGEVRRLKIGIVLAAIIEILAVWWMTADDYVKPGGLL